MSLFLNLCVCTKSATFACMEFYFAPFHGISMRLFRQVYFRYFTGMDYVVAPFVAATPAAGLKTAYFSDIYPADENVALIPQLIGNNADDIAGTTAYLYELGYHQVNLNMGCPMPKIVHKQRACGLMPHPDIVCNIVEKVLKASPVKLSLKMRLGWADPTEVLRMLQAVQPYDLDFIAIHARLGVQQYEGKPHMDIFARCMQATGHKLVYNGDIFTPEDYKHILSLFPQLQACLLGRGMLRNPFLLYDIQHAVPMPMQQKQALFARFYADLWQTYASYYRPEVMLNRMKELWKYFSVCYGLSPAELSALLRITGYDQFYDATFRITQL